MTNKIKKQIERKLYGYDLLRQSVTPEAKAWCETIDACLTEWQGQPKEKLLRLRYFERVSIQETLERLFIDRSTYFNWLDRMLSDLAIKAAYKRLIKP